MQELQQDRLERINRHAYMQEVWLGAEQEERKAREDTASIVQNANALDFDLLRAIASSAGQSYPIETIVPALDEFRGAGEEHFRIELVELHSVLKEAIDSQVEDTSWEAISQATDPHSRRDHVWHHQVPLHFHEGKRNSAQFE